jgi:PHD/YefM family antitoxin component YafN of YafNO toxin-antitoxin module
MKDFREATVKSTKMVENYKACRKKAKKSGKVFVLENNQPDAVLFTAAEYERISWFIEYFEEYDDEEIALVSEFILSKNNKNINSIDYYSESINKEANFG